MALLLSKVCREYWYNRKQLETWVLQVILELLAQQGTTGSVASKVLSEILVQMVILETTGATGAAGEQGLVGKYWFN